MNKVQNFHSLLEAHSPEACERIDFKIVLFKKKNKNIVLTDKSDFDLKIDESHSPKSTNLAVLWTF